MKHHPRTKKANTGPPHEDPNQKARLTPPLPADPADLRAIMPDLVDSGLFSLYAREALIRRIGCGGIPQS